MKKLTNRWGHVLTIGQAVIVTPIRGSGKEHHVIVKLDRSSDYAKTYGPRAILESGGSASIDDLAPASPTRASRSEGSLYAPSGARRNPLSAHAAAIMGNEKRKIHAWTGGTSWKKETTGERGREFAVSPAEKAIARKLFNEQMREYKKYWHRLPDADTKKIFRGRADADAYATIRAGQTNPARRDMENRIAVQFHAHGVWATIKTFPNTVAGRKAAKAYAVKAIKKIPHTFRAVTVNQ